MIQSPEFTQQVIALLERAGLSPAILSVQNCASGGNNRTYRLETVDGVFAVKKYFRQDGDTRDRLASEFSFLTYAKTAAPDMVPIPYSQDADAGMALYEFIDGVPLKASDITEKEITQAIQFFCALNKPQSKSRAVTLPQASEACFAIQDHLDLIGARIHGLKQIESTHPEDKAAKELVNYLSATWQKILNDVKSAAIAEGIDVAASLSNSQRCISPSDFGFHNALKMANGTIRFLDFEYAGWDDPAKMTGDFFSQLAIPIPANYFDHFVRAVMAPFSQPEVMIRRAQLLRSVYQVKWCCIALNVFIPVNLARRRFANPDLNVDNLKKLQLSKAEFLLQNLEQHNYA